LPPGLLEPCCNTATALPEIAEIARPAAAHHRDAARFVDCAAPATVAAAAMVPHAAGTFGTGAAEPDTTLPVAEAAACEPHLRQGAPSPPPVTCDGWSSSSEGTPRDSGVDGQGQAEAGPGTYRVHHPPLLRARTVPALSSARRRLAFARRPRKLSGPDTQQPSSSQDVHSSDSDGAPCYVLDSTISLREDAATHPGGACTQHSRRESSAAASSLVETSTQQVGGSGCATEGHASFTAPPAASPTVSPTALSTNTVRRLRKRAWLLVTITLLAMALFIARAFSPFGGPPDAHVSMPFHIELPRRRQQSHVSVVGSWDKFATPLPLAPLERLAGADARRYAPLGWRASEVWRTPLRIPCGAHLYRFVIDGRRHWLDRSRPAVMRMPLPEGFTGPALSLGHRAPLNALREFLWRRPRGRGDGAAAFHVVQVDGEGCT